MKNRFFRIPLLACALLSGCAAPTRQSSSPSAARTPVSYSVPEPCAYFKGGNPDFAARGNPDPLGRKFRIADIRPSVTFWQTPSVPSSEIPNSFIITYLSLRDQAKDSKTGQYYRRNGGTDVNLNFNWFDMIRKLQSLPDGLFVKMATGRSNADADTVAFMSRCWNKLDNLNAELAQRYPALFSIDEKAFPLDIVLSCLQDTAKGVRLHSLFEAWILGIPEHADIPGSNSECRKIIPAEEGFLIPYDAIAAAVFKLSDEQWKGLEPANPDDHAWIQQP